MAEESKGQVIPFQPGRPKGRRTYTASSFPPEFMELFLRALDQGEFFLPCARATAINLRQKLYMFRKCLERENHPYARQLAKLTIQLKQRDGSPTDHGLLITKQYGELAALLREAGIRPGDSASPAGVLPDLTTPEDEAKFAAITSRDFVRDFLSEEGEEERGSGESESTPPPPEPPIEDL